MTKIKRKVSIKKDKDKNKNKGKININIHIDQSKRTGTNNPKRSNIKTLPAFSSAPSSGGNYARYFQQDPYMTQSQIENTKLLQQYNNELKKQNLQLTYGFRNNNINDQQLLLTNNTTANNQNRLTQSNETIQEEVIDSLTNDDPRTNFDPNNALFKENLPSDDPLEFFNPGLFDPNNEFFKKNIPPRLPKNDDLNTKDDLIKYDKEEQKQPKLITNEANYIISAMHDESKPRFLNGYKIYRDENVPSGKYYNFNTGKFVNFDDKEFVRISREHGSNLNNYYTRDPYEINEFLQETVRGNDKYELIEKNKAKNFGWYRDRDRSSNIEVDKDKKPVGRPKKET